MALLPAGILSVPSGPIGAVKIRRTKSGNVLVLPRKSRDARSPAQILARQRFATVARLSSLCYKTTLKPFWIKPWKGYNAFARSIQRSLPSWSEWHGLPRFYLGGEWELPKIVGASYWSTSDQIHKFVFNSYSNPWLQPGDRIFVGVLTPGVSMLYTLTPAVWPQDTVAYAVGPMWPAEKPVRITSFCARDVDGLYDLLSTPTSTYFLINYDFLIPPAVME